MKPSRKFAPVWCHRLLARHKERFEKIFYSGTCSCSPPCHFLILWMGTIAHRVLLLSCAKHTNDSGFYKASWDILGAEVLSSIANFFTCCFMPASANSTILSLVPKHTGASLITDYRPISCLNTVYKVVSRLLVRRLKPLLPSLIVPCLGISSSPVFKALTSRRCIFLGSEHVSFCDRYELPLPYA